MELQRTAAAFDEAGVALYALSYDEPDALAAARDELGITFTLLSDPDSEVIRSFGILNTLVPEDDHPWFGIPFPGAYVVDESGTIVAKSFERHLAVRATGEQLLRAATGDTGALPDAPAIDPSSAPPAEVEVTVWADDAPLPFGMQRDLHVVLRVPEGHHLYGEPVPEGLVATHVEFDEHIDALEPTLPETTPLAVPGIDQPLEVYEGDVHLVAPFAIYPARAAQDGMHVVTGTVRYQICDDEACGLPARERFEVRIPVQRHATPDFAGTRPDSMDFATHFTRMTTRRNG